MPGEITAILGEGTRFEGKLIFDGVVRVDGEFKGEIFSRNTLILGEKSVVHAEVDADTVVVGGTFEGNINALSRVEVLDGGIVKGNIRAPVIKIDEGGGVEGSTQMQSLG